MERSRLFSIRTRIRMDRFSGVCKRRHVGKKVTKMQVDRQTAWLPIWSFTRHMHEHYFEQGRQEGKSCYYLLGNLTRNYFKETVVSRMRSILTGRSVSEWLNTVLGFSVSHSYSKVSTIDVLELQE
jgi:hypothetical protein